MRHAWRALILSTANAFCCAGPLVAQTVEREPTAQVEQYHGVTRVDAGQKQRTETPPLAPMPNPTLTPTATPAVEIKPAADAKESSGWRPAVEVPANDIKSAPEIKDTACFKTPTVQPIPVVEVLPKLEAAPLKSVENANNAPPSNFASRYENTKTPSPEVGNVGFVAPASESRGVQPPVDAPWSPPRPPSEPEARLSPEAVWIQAGPALTGAVLTPLILLLGLAILLRRLKGFAGPVIRVENVGGAGQSFSLKDLAGLLQAEVLRTPSSQAAPQGAAAEAPLEPTTAVPFDLGPTFEDEILLRQEQDRQQDLGLLEKLFQDNVQLQKQLDQPAPALA